MTITAWLKIKPEIIFLNIKNIKSDQLKFKVFSKLRAAEWCVIVAGMAWASSLSSPAQQAFE